MKTKLASTLAIAAIAVLVAGITLPMTQIQNASANPGFLRLIFVNKINNGDGQGNCFQISDEYSVQNENGDDGNQPNCHSGDNAIVGTYSRNNNGLLYSKDYLTSHNINSITLILKGDHGQTLDTFTYNIHDLANIDQAQIRMCTGENTDPICAAQRIIFEG